MQAKTNDHCLRGAANMTPEIRETITYQGFLSLQDVDESEDVLFLSSEEEPLANVLFWMCGKNVTARWYTAKKQATKEEIEEGFVAEWMGLANGDGFSPYYSELTGYLWADENMNIGGHDLIEVLKSSVGRWLILEIDVHEDVSE